MGRGAKYETHVKPYLDNIKNWIQLQNEGDIAKRLGISRQTLEKYKKEHEELRKALKEGRAELVEDLKLTLKRKAKGYRYKEVRTIIRDIDGKKIKVIEELEKEAHPDVGAIHLLLKNLDETWRNDDAETTKLKKEQVKIAKEKAENAAW